MDIQKLLNEYGDNVFSLAVIATKSTQTATEIYFNTFERAVAEGITDENTLFAICAELSMETEINEDASTITDFKMKKTELEFCEKLLVLSQKTRIVMHLYYNYDLEMSAIGNVLKISEKNAQKLFDEVPAELHELAEENYLTAMITVIVSEKTFNYALEKFTKGDGRLFEVRGDAAPQHTWTKKQKIVVTIVAIIITIVVCVVVPIVQMLINQAHDNEGIDLDPSEPSVTFTAGVETEDAPEDFF